MKAVFMGAVGFVAIATIAPPLFSAEGRRDAENAETGPRIERIERRAKGWELEVRPL